MLKRAAIVATAIVGGALLVAGPASAHSHYLTLPNGGTTNIANGGHEGALWHPLHCLVHIGTPGTQAFDNPNNPVDIFREGAPPASTICETKPGNLP